MTSSVPLRLRADVMLGRMRDPASEQGPLQVPYLRAANIDDGFLNLADTKSMHFDPREQRRYRLTLGDVLVTEASGSRDQVGQSASVDQSAVGKMFQNTLLRLRPLAETDGRFLYWWSRHAFASGTYARASQGLGIWHLGAERLRALPFPAAPVEEQRRVADFLDDQIAALDHAIQLRHRQLSLLQDLLRTRVDSIGDGSNPGLAGAPLLRAGLVVSVLPGYAFPSAEFDDVSGTRLLRGINVGVRRTSWREAAYWTGSDKSLESRFGLGVGDVVMGMDRPWITEGLRIARLTENDLPSLLLQRVAKLTPRSEMIKDYIFWSYQAREFRMGVEGQLTGLSVPHLSGEQISAHRLYAPSLDVQRGLVAELNKVAADLADASHLQRYSVLLLQERKQALITAAVTGEFDVSTASVRTVA